MSHAVNINGEKLKAMLKGAKINQSQLSQDMGYGKQYLSVAIISNRISWRAVNLLKLIGIDPDEYVIHDVLPKKAEEIIEKKVAEIEHEEKTYTKERTARAVEEDVNAKALLRKNVIEQSALCMMLMYRLNSDIENGITTTMSQKQDDIVKLRRELNNLKYFLQWEWNEGGRL